MKLLPSHPDVANAEIRNMTREQINGVASPHMKDFFNKKKDEADSQSRVSDDIVRQVFGKKANQSIKETLYAAIRLKEERIKAKQNSVFPLIDKVTLLQIIDEVQITYTGKGVTNMPKATLIDLFNRKLTVKI